ncbi:hypothetical protein AcW1_003703 [Taiwanofungus camphoratus]|nr:hypothetical protein AcV5_003618 [Antrodia cinnamomea]KAI0940532.1 hypothetical protein AcW1_003703 [Antrodia cinnamomea]
MEPSSVAEQRATAVAKLKRAASLPRMKDGRRPPMHVEAVSEGERAQGEGEKDDESAQESDGKGEQQEGGKQEQEQGSEALKEEVQDEEVKAPPPETPLPAENTPVRAKRRSRSRTRSRGSRDLKGKALAKQSPHVSSASHTNESSADEYYTSAPGEDPPPSPPLVSPIPSHLAAFPPRLLASPFLYPGTTPSTPLPTLDDIRQGISMGLYRSNSAGAARAMAMHKLTGGTEPMDYSLMSPSPTPPPGGPRLTRNNTVSGGERMGDRMAARQRLLHRLGNRIKEVEGDQTSGGEELPAPTLPPKRRRRRSRRNSSRASTVVDDREDREPPSTTPNTPIVPPSPLPPTFHHAPDPPRPPSAASRVANGDAGRASPLVKSNGNIPFDYEKPTGHRGVVVEDEDDVPERLSPQRLPLPPLPSTPGRGYGHPSTLRLPHTSDAPSSTSTDSGPASAIRVPFFVSRKSVAKPDTFPASPFATPLKEKPYPDEDEEQVLYQEVHRPRLAFERESEISWIAEPVPERMPVHDDDDEDTAPEPEAEAEDADEPLAEISDQRSNHSYGRPSSRPVSPKDLVIEFEISPVTQAEHTPPSPTSPVVLSPIITSDARTGSQVSPTTYPMRLSVATPSQLERSPSTGDFPDFEDARATVTDSTIKRAAESTSRWERVKNMVTRSGSVNGRRSRTNSLGIRDRRNNTDSSVSRESGVSLSKGDKGDTSGNFTHQHSQDAQSPSASASISSLPLAQAPIAALAPAPPATPVDLMMYGDSKLFPFPGMLQLEEQRNRAKGLSQSSSNPDVTSPIGLGIDAVPSGSSSSSAATRVPQSDRERRLSHQASDTRLLAKYNNVVSPPPMSSVSSSASQNDYFSIQSAGSPTSPTANGYSSLKLPMDRLGVRKWLSAKFSSPNGATSPSSDGRSRSADKKPSWAEVPLGRKESELPEDWEDLGRAKSRTPTSAASSALLGKQPKEEARPTEIRMETEATVAHDSSPETIQSPRTGPDMNLRTNGITSPSHTSDFSASFPSPPEPPSSTTPDPQSSLDDFPARSTSESFSDTLSSSHHSPDPPSSEPSEAAIVMERLDEVLGRGSKSALWPNAIDDPPRKLILSSPVLQVANANTVKDRFLFLFNDILVITKPIVQDRDALLDPMKPSPTDRKYIVKSVVQLRELKFSDDRDEARSKTSSNSNSTRHPVIRSFVHQFAKDPDHAISVLFSRTNTRDDPITLGQLLFRTVDLDRARLGEYLSRRSSKVVLKAYVDSFGLTGLRIDKALRVFLLAINIPAKSIGTSPLEYLLDAFSSRWYEANAAIVAYDKDLAIRLVRAIVQLNEVMHGGIAQETSVTGYPIRNVIARDFVDAFRRSDPRCLVSDDLLDKVYTSIRREKLSQARNPSYQTGDSDVPVTIKRPLPSRLTYRVQSEPIILRISQPDPQLTIQLFGQDLIFDPPTLTFARSSEASFRVTGTSLGSKAIIMWRSGPNALAYCGLPLSSPVVVERAFMRNTFQLAFANHNGAKRKYMFSVDDPLIRHQWAVSLKRQIEFSATSDAAGPSSKTQKVTEDMAFRVLQETLISPEDEYPPVPLSPRDQALARLTGSRHRPNGSISSNQGGTGAQSVTGTSSPRRLVRDSSSHARSKSRSQIYHQQGAGKLELDLHDATEPSDEDQLQPQVSGQSSQQRLGGRLWDGRDLETVCRQNSLIASVLAYLQVDRRNHDASNGAVS